jgi:hypothetical protein
MTTTTAATLIRFRSTKIEPPRSRRRSESSNGAGDTDRAQAIERLGQMRAEYAAGSGSFDACP